MRFARRETCKSGVLEYTQTAARASSRGGSTFVRESVGEACVRVVELLGRVM